MLKIYVLIKYPTMLQKFLQQSVIKDLLMEHFNDAIY